MIADTPVLHINSNLIDLSSVETPHEIVKRDGRVVAFNMERIRRALQRCFEGINRTPHTSLDDLLLRIVNSISMRNGTPTVEGIQNIVEMTLAGAGEFEAAKAYILYRAEHARLREERPVPPEIRAIFEESDAYFPTQLQKFQFFDKYSRWRQDLSRRETWPETVDRAVSFLHELVTDNVGAEVAGGMVAGNEFGRIRESILNMRAMPSMRLLAMAGPAARRQNASLYNCTFVAVDSLDAFVEALLLSMAGCGVGFSVERRHIEKLPEIKFQREGVPVSVFRVADSTEGWGDAVRAGLTMWFEGYDIEFNFDDVRKAGEPLKIKGGRASGADPLRNTLAFARERILARQGTRLRPLDAHDIMCTIGTAAVSGGVRRTAMISLFDIDDTDMLNCKAGDFETSNNQRWNANNSAIIPERGVSQAQLLKLWTAMVESGRGEPGFVSRQAMKRTLPVRREWDPDFGVNPCFAPGTLIHTRDGHFPVESLVGKTVEVWDGERWHSLDNFRVTAEHQPTLKIAMHDGSEIRVTPYHSMILEDGRRIEARELQPDMHLAISQAPLTHGNLSEPAAYLKGFLLGDGSSTKKVRPLLDLYSTKYECADRLARSAEQLAGESVRTNALVAVGFGVENGYGRRGMTGLAPRQAELIDWTTTYRERLPQRVFAWDQATKLEFLAGLFDADGTVMDTTNGFGYQLSSIHRELLLDVQALLKTIGVRSKLALMKAGGTRDFGDGYGEYESKDCWRLTVSQAASIVLAGQVTFTRLKSLADRTTVYKQKPRFNRVVAIDFDRVYDKVYCCTVSSSHSLALTNGMQIGQCGEIVLKPMELCNLSIAVARHDDTLESLLDKVEVASIIGTIQSLATHFPGLRPQWAENARAERLLGVDITGQRDCPLLNDTQVLRQLRERAVEVNQQWAEYFGINQSAAVTTVKPSGNSAVLLNVSSGIHGRWAPYYIRNVRVSATSPVYKVLRDAGVPMNPENGQTQGTANTYVASFPVASPEGVPTRNDLSALQQVEYWLERKLNWTEHNPSCTITYRDHETVPLLAWVVEHIQELGGMAFLPHDDGTYAQPPYMEITREEYEQRAADFPVIDFSRLVRYEVADLTTASQELACVGDRCEV